MTEMWSFQATSHSTTSNEVQVHLSRVYPTREAAVEAMNKWLEERAPAFVAEGWVLEEPSVSQL